MLKASYVLVTAIAIATLVPVSLAITGIGPELSQKPTVGVYDNAESKIADPKGDAEAVYQKNGTEPVPLVQEYHDIVGASVVRQGDAFNFSIQLAGNPNNNVNYETVYRWHVVTTSPATNEQQQYAIIFPNFVRGNSTSDGWYFALYDETINTFIVNLTKINGMPEDRVEFAIRDSDIGNPTKFIYWVDVSVRVNATLGEPDYLMDYAP